MKFVVEKVYVLTCVSEVCVGDLIQILNPSKGDTFESCYQTERHTCIDVNVPNSQPIKNSGETQLSSKTNENICLHKVYFKHLL